MMHTKELVEWTTQFVKGKDAIKKSIQAMDMKDDRLIVTYKEKKQVYLVLPELELEKIQKEIAGDIHLAVVTLNTDNNFTFLLEHWKELAKHQKLSVYFVNPQSATETKWIIFPHTHNKIADKDSLKLGINSMAETVEKVT